MNSKNLIVNIILLTVIICSCSKEEPNPVPTCLATKIEEFKEDQRTCENASIKKYSYQAQEVYAFTQGICIADGGTDVVLEDCSQICFLGGFAGNQDCNGDLFFDVAQVLETIWEAN